MVKLEVELVTIPGSYAVDRLASTDATTKRNADGTGMTANLTDLKITALYPAPAEIVTEAGLEGSAREYRQVFAQIQNHLDGGTLTEAIPDILEGDSLVVASLEYRVRAVMPWGELLRVIVGERVGND